MAQEANMSRSAGLISIFYYLESGEEVEVLFHAVISEAHEVTTEITKFPVQTGFEISNHAIKKNRKVVIEAIVTNTPLVGQVEFGTTNPSIYMFEALQTLVSSAVPCTVSTNLGFYEPVVFTKFTTKQSAGSMDSMQFTMSGEELQVQDTLNKTAPKVLKFSLVPDEKYQGYVDRLACSGIRFEGKPEISTAEITEGEDFSIGMKSLAGVAGVVTYLNKGKNSATGMNTYEAHTTDTEYHKPVAVGETSFFDIDPKYSEKLTRGAEATTTCMKDGVVDIATNVIDNFIDTQVGKLESTLYGAKLDIMQLGGSAAGQALVGLGLDCVVAGVAATFTDPVPPDPCDETFKISPSLPTVDDAIFGLSEQVPSVRDLPKPQELIKIAGGFF
jgi:hypothetical protein